MHGERPSEFINTPVIIPDITCEDAGQYLSLIPQVPTPEDALTIAILNRHSREGNHTPDCPCRLPFSGVPTPSALPEQIDRIDYTSTPEEGSQQPE